MSDATSPIDPAIAARLSALEALVAAQQAALEAERARRTDAEAERDRLREAYEALTREVELARRRLIVAKAERIDTTQLEIEFATKLAALDELAGKAEDDGVGKRPKPERDTGKKKHGRRDLRLCDLPEERIEIPDPLLDGKAARIGTEESTGLRWKRGGFVRVVFVRFKYSTSTPAIVKTSAETSDPPAASDPSAPSAHHAAAAGETAARQASTVDPTTSPGSATSATTVASSRGEPACTSEELQALVASEPRTAGAAIVTAPMPPRLLERAFATPSLIAHVASDKFCDGLPLHRQEDRFARLGVPIDRGTMCRWLEEVGATVGATIVEAMRREALATAHCIATDATGVLVQPEPRPDKQSQPCRRAHFFVQIADADHVFFEYTSRETSEVVSQLFADYAGFIQADAKSVFDILYRPPKERDRADEDRADRAVCTEVGCWSHYLELFVISSCSRRVAGASSRPSASRFRNAPDNAGSQRFEKGEQLRRWAPAAIAGSLEARSLPECLEDVALHLQVRGEVAVCCRDARVAKVVADDGKVDARLKEGHRATVAKHMRGDMLTPQGRRRCGSTANMFRDHEGDPVPGEWCPARVAEQRLVRRGHASDEQSQGGRGLRPDRANALLVALAA